MALWNPGPRSDKNGPRAGGETPSWGWRANTSNPAGGRTRSTPQKKENLDRAGEGVRKTPPSRGEGGFLRGESLTWGGTGAEGGEKKSGSFEGEKRSSSKLSDKGPHGKTVASIFHQKRENGLGRQRKKGDGKGKKMGNLKKKSVDRLENVKNTKRTPMLRGEGAESRHWKKTTMMKGSANKHSGEEENPKLVTMKYGKKIPGGWLHKRPRDSSEKFAHIKTKTTAKKLISTNSGEGREKGEEEKKRKGRV